MLACVGSAWGHDIPNDVTVQMFVRPGPQRLNLLVRVPMKAIRDVDFPQRAGYLDIERTEPLLPDASQLWIGSFLEVYEAGRRLPKPRVAAAAAILGVVALAACYLPATRASRLDPVSALRED